MKLPDIINRPPFPAPWSEGDNIPWDDPAFSRRMLVEHLSQAHDMASRRAEKIDRHVRWINEHMLHERPGRVLDLACGPGLYTSRLAALGHLCTGIDYAPAAIAYARAQADTQQAACTYIQDDIRTAEYGAEFDLIMLIFGEFNVFRPMDARLILRKAQAALAASGALLLEPHTVTAIERMGEAPNTWYSRKEGLFSDKPHMVLQENHWDSQARAATIRYYVLGATGQVAAYAQSMQAYGHDDYVAILNQGGFDQIDFWPSLSGEEDSGQRDLLAITAHESDNA